MTTKPIPVKQIPGTVTKVDIATGKETHEGMAWNILPPPKHCCQICGRAHEPENPHDVQQIYYQMTFNGMIGRAPTWADAVAHCVPEVQKAWRDELTRTGNWTEPPEGETPVKHHGVET
jgi:hypothetical protein